MLTTHSIPILELLEIRWVEKINHNVLVYINIISDVIDKYQPNSIEVIGHSRLEQLAAAIAKTKKVAITKNRAASFIPNLISAIKDKRSYHSRALYEIFKTNKSYLSDQTKKPKKILGDQKKVLFVAELNRTITTVLPIIDLLNEKGVLTLVIAKNRVTCKQDFINKGATFSKISDWITIPEADEIVEKSRSNAVKGWEKIIGRQDSINAAMKGVKIFPFVKDIISSALIEGSEHARLTTEIAERCINTWSPDLIVHFEETELNRAFMMIGKKKGIQSLSYYTLSPNARPNLVRRRADWLATSGELLKDLFIKHFDDLHIKVVGHTAYNKITISEKEKLRNGFCEKYKLEKKSPIILMLSKTQVMPPWQRKDVNDHFQGTFEAIKKIKNIQIVIKHHPLQDKLEIYYYLNKYNIKATVLSDYNLIELSLISDLVSVQTTSAAWYPMSVGTPVVSVQSEKLLKHYNYIKYDYLKNKGVVCIEPGDDGSSVFNDLLFDKEKRKIQIEKGYAHAAEHFGILDGKASQRLGNFLHDIISS